MRNKPDNFYAQSAVVPYRILEGRLEVVLISSRKRKRWVIPKGIREPGMASGESAAKEALEEAGLVGTVSPNAIGSYSYEKWGGNCSVEVFAMQVSHEHEQWEEDFRDREWMPVTEAAVRVQERKLKHIILSLPLFLRLG